MSYVRISRNSRKSVLRVQGLKHLTKEAVEYGSYVSGRGLVKATSADILRKPKKGRTYVRRDRLGRRRRHVASAPGETHANMTGKLRRSLQFVVRGSRELKFGYGAQRNDAPDYADIENGLGKVSPRPSLRNNIKAERRNMINNYEREIRRRLT